MNLPGEPTPKVETLLEDAGPATFMPLAVADPQPALPEALPL